MPKEETLIWYSRFCNIYFIVAVHFVSKVNISEYKKREKAASKTCLQAASGWSHKNLIDRLNVGD
ncbi:hypothetical protein [Desulfovibrio sp. ZJ200]|uniref:hypothetical protein n=1 Tax=Desulfovibrio sp. ZJ200 TaxID=2709792 RepID=UPI00197F0046|nr:hypothetical protein [Desulfovibrio sp. ZJ200]